MDPRRLKKRLLLFHVDSQTYSLYMAALEIGGKILYTTAEEKLAAEGITVTPFTDEQNAAHWEHIYTEMANFRPELRRKQAEDEWNTAKIVFTPGLRVR